MFSKYKSGLIQLNSGPDIKKNLRSARDLCNQAKAEGADIILLPECTPFLGPDSELLNKIDEIESAFMGFLQDTSKELQVPIVAGGYVAAQSKGLAQNCLIYYDAHKNKIFTYLKVHLFDVSIPDGMNYQESNTIVAGNDSAKVFRNSDFGNLGFSICYDLRFPEMYRKQVQAGANVLLIPAAFTEFTGKAHWHTLVRARAIENLSYVLAPAQTGKHYDKRISYGHTMAVDPWGEIINELDENPGFLIVEVEFDKIEKARNRIPSLNLTVK